MSGPHFATGSRTLTRTVRSTCRAVRAECPFAVLAFEELLRGAGMLVGARLGAAPRVEELAADTFLVGAFLAGAFFFGAVFAGVLLSGVLLVTGFFTGVFPAGVVFFGAAFFGAASGVFFAAAFDAGFFRAPDARSPCARVLPSLPRALRRGVRPLPSLAGAFPRRPSLPPLPSARFRATQHPLSLTVVR